MAQVKIRKYAGGGGISINNEFYSADDVNALMETLPQERKETLGAIVAQINSGKTFTYDPNNNSISGEGIDDLMNGYFGSEKAASRGQKNNGRVSRSIDATLGNKRDSMRRGLAELALLKHINKPSSEDAATTSTLEALGKGSGWFDVNKEGVYDKTLGNQAKIDHLNKYKDYFGLGREEGDKKYKVSSDNLDSLWNYYNSFGDSNYIDSLISTITNKPGDLSQEQINFLNALGYSKDDAGNSGSDVESPWSISNPDLKRQSAGWFAKDDNGRYQITQEGYNYFKDLGIDANSNYWFGQFWNKPLNMNDDVWNNILKDKMLYEGRLYDAREVNGQIGSDVSDIIHNYAKTAEGSNFYDLIRSGDFSNANGLINYLGGNQLQYDLVDNEHYSGLGEGFRWRSEEGRYSGLNKPEGDDNWQFISYFDPKADSDSYGFRTPTYGWINKLTGEVRGTDEGFNLADYSLTNASPSEIFLPKYASINPDDSTNGLIREDLTGSDKTPNGVELYYDPKNPSRMLYKDGNGDAFDISDLGLNREIIYKINNDPVLRQRFNNTLKALTSSGWSQMWTNELSESEWTKIVGDSALASQIYKNIEKKKNEGSKEQRSYRIKSLPAHLTGGVIKMAYGGTTGGNSSNIQSSTTVRKVSDKKSEDLNPTQSKGAGEVMKNLNHLSDQDASDLIALLADIGSAGLAFTSFGTASAVTGAVGSTARFRSDVTRDGFQGKDLANYGINLLMDAATAVPVLGSLAKLGKLGRGIAKSAPTLIKVASAYGMTQAIPVINKIANGDKVTLRDLSTITNVITAGVGFSKSGLKNGKTKVTTEGNATVNYKVGDKTKSYTVTDKKLLSNVEGLQAKIKESLGNPNTNVEVTVPTKEVRPMSNFFRKKQVVDAEWKPAKTETSYQEIVDPYAGGIKNWFKGTGKYNMYNRALGGESSYRTYVGDFSNLPSGVASQGSLMNLNVPVVTTPKDVPINVKNIITPNVLLSQDPTQYYFTPGYIPEDYVVSYEKEGGVLKAEYGLGLAKLNFDFKPVDFKGEGIKQTTFDPNWKPEITPVTIGNYEYNLQKGTVTPKNTYQFNSNTDFSKIFTQKPTTETPTEETQTQQQTKTETFGDGFARNPIKFSPSKAIDLMRFANSLRTARNLRNIRKEQATVDGMNFSSRLNYAGSNIYLSGAGDEYRKAASTLEGEAARLASGTSDGAVAAAVRMGQHAKAAELTAQGDAIDAKEYAEGMKANEQGRLNWKMNVELPQTQERTAANYKHAMGDLNADGDYATEVWRNWESFGKDKQVAAARAEALEDEAAYDALTNQASSKYSSALERLANSYMPKDYAGTYAEYLADIQESNPTLYKTITEGAARSAEYNPYLLRAKVLSSRNPLAGWGLRNSTTAFVKNGGILDKDYARKLIKHEN